MRLRVLGSSGGYPAPGNPSTGFLLEHGAAKLWIDAGNGTFAVEHAAAPAHDLDALDRGQRHGGPLHAGQVDVVDAPAVDMDRARPALSVVAALLGAGQVKVLAQGVQQRGAGIEL